jgi:hypothetical protein
MSEKKEVSIFDNDIAAAEVTRSHNRRKAVIIPLKKGQEMMAKIEK